MNPTASELVKAADALYQQGKFDKAGAAYMDALAVAPDHPKILKQLGNIALWNNRSAQAEQYYLGALRATPWYANFWPLTSELKYRLSLTYYRQDRFAEAAAIMREAVGPVAVGPLADLQALGRQMELLAGQPAYKIEGPEESRVAFVATDPLPIVEVAVNNHAPQYFIVDTGGMEIVLDDDLAAEAGAQIGGTVNGTYAGGKTAATGLGRVESIQIGDFVVRNVPVHILDTDPWSADFGREIKGVVGTRFLMHFLSTIDYPHQCLILRQLTPANLQDLERQITADGAKEIPFWLIETHYIVAWGTVNDLAPMLFFVDTGLGSRGFTAPESILQAAGITVDWTRTEERAGGGTEPVRSVDFVVRRLTLGTGPDEVVEYEVLGSAIEGSIPTLQGQRGFQISGLISHAFFRHHALTLDFTGMRLVMQEGEAAGGDGHAPMVR